MDALLNNCAEYMLTHELAALLNAAYASDADKTSAEIPVETPAENPAETPVETPVDNPVETPVDNPVETPANKVTTPSKYTIFYPDLDDSLFWCMYVHEHGLAAYETQRLLKKNMVNTMMTVKRQMYDHFNKDKNQTLKHTNHKITNATINEIKCDLMTRSLSSMQNLIACCVYWKCAIVVELGDNVYAKFVCNDYVEDCQQEEDNNTVLLYVIKASKKNTFKFAMETDKNKVAEKLQNMRQTWYKIDHYHKPIRAIGNYGLSDLLKLYSIICVGGNDATKMKKQDLYYSIVVKLGTMTVKQFV